MKQRKNKSNRFLIGLTLATAGAIIVPCATSSLVINKKPSKNKTTLKTNSKVTQTILLNNNVVDLSSKQILSLLNQTTWSDVSEIDVVNFINDFNTKSLLNISTLINNNVAMFNKAVDSYHLTLNNKNRTIEINVSLKDGYIFDNYKNHHSFIIMTPYTNQIKLAPKVIDGSTLSLTPDNILNKINQTSWSNVVINQVNNFITSFNNDTIIQQAKLVMNDDIIQFIKVVDSYQLSLDINHQIINSKVNLKEQYVFKDKTNKLLIPVNISYKK